MLRRRPPGAGSVLVPVEPARREPALDAIGTLVVERADGVPLAGDEAAARWCAWSAATLGYLAGVADSLLERTVAYARSREQFGRPLGALPAVQARLADTAVARDGSCWSHGGRLAGGWCAVYRACVGRTGLP